MGLNDSAWEALFQKYDILSRIAAEGQFFISANQIKAFREPRLMTKFDHRVNLPALFADNGLAILPVTRGDYVIAPFAAYHDFEPPQGAPRRVRLPVGLQSLAPRFLVSEAIALNCAAACGILEDFLEDEAVVPTVSGRMGSGRFSFSIDVPGGEREVVVNNAQIEIDAACEGRRFLSLFEAKRDLADDFLVRQLYYPYRVWSERVTKPVKSVFLVFTNGVFHLYEYRFEQPERYCSLRLVKQRSYTLTTGITRSDIGQLLTAAPLLPEPEISFPQANSMARVVNLAELLSGRDMTRDEITAEYAFDARQTNYYTDAGRYLGLMEKDRRDGTVCFRLSALGRRILSMDLRERQLALAGQILGHRAFREAMGLCLRSGEMPPAGAVVEIMKASGLYHVASDSTYFRRASTVTGWLNWILDLAE